MSLFDPAMLKDGRIFTALCQDKECRATLGGLHIPCQGGLVLFICQKCGTASVFKNELYGIKAEALGRTKISSEPAARRVR